MEKEKVFIKEGRPDGDDIENVSEFLGIWQKRLDKFDSQRPTIEDNERKTLEDEKTQEILSSHSKDFANFNRSKIKLKRLDKKGSKQIKAKIYSVIEKEPNLQSITKVVGKRSTDLPSLEGFQDLEFDRKVHKSLDIFIRQTMGCKPYMSFISRPNEKPLQKIIEHQQAINKCVKSLKVNIDVLDGLEDNANVEPHQDDLGRDSSRIKWGDSLERGLQADRTLQITKSNVPQVVVVAKNPGKQNPSTNYFTDIPGWPLLSPSKVQLQKCEKCSLEFFSTFNHRRHSRTHQRISHIDKEDLLLKRKNVAAFWDKLNQDEVQQIFSSSRKYDLEDLSGEVVVSHLFAFKKDNNLTSLPPNYVKAGQDLLDMLDCKEIVLPLCSEQIISILDETSEKTFLSSQHNASKIGLEEKNLMASLGFIVEQTLVKAWMADKDAESLRNQQELVEEEEASQMKRERNVAKKKKKKEKSRRRGLKECKSGPSQLILNDENESIYSENPSLEIVEEDNSPTASSASMNSSGLENPLLEHLDMEVNNQVQNIDERIQIVGEVGHPKISKNIALELVDEEKAQEIKCDLTSYSKKEEQCFAFPYSIQIKVVDQEGCDHALEQDQNVVESYKHISLKPYRELFKVDNEDSYQRRGCILHPKFQEGIQQNFHRILRKPLTGIPCTSNIELHSNSIPRFYHGKPISFKGTVPFSMTQYWTKKTHMSIAAKYINKKGHGNECTHKHDTSTNKSNAKDLIEEHTILAHEIHTDTIGCISRAKKEDFRTFEKKEPSPIEIPSMAKVVVGKGGLNIVPTTSFNLNINSEDWPPLSNLQVTNYPKSTGMYSLTSYQCEIKSMPSEKFNFDRNDGYKVGLEYKVEESIVTAIPPIKHSINETTIGSIAPSLQKGIMIGLVSVPLGDHGHSSRLELESASKRICTPLLAHQSYTTVLATPSVRYIQDTMANSEVRQLRTNDEINHLEYRVSSNVQVNNSYGGPIHYRTLSARSTPCINLHIRHIRRSTYPLGDRGERGILPKHPSWLSGAIRNLPQKVWRPIRSLVENIDSNLRSGMNIESSPTSSIKKMTTMNVGRKESNDVASSQPIEGNQVRDANINKVERYQAFTANSKAQIRYQTCILDVKNKKKNAPKDVKDCDDPLINLDNEHSHNCQKTFQIASMEKINSNNIYQLLKDNASEVNIICKSHGKKGDTNENDDMPSVETSLGHSTWITEVVDFHLNRWQLGLKDPETVVGDCKEEHPELQTSRWMDFLNTLPFIKTRLNNLKTNIHDVKLMIPNNSEKNWNQEFYLSTR